MINSKKKRLLIIPAKGFSKRIKKKNYKFFFGKPIIEYSIDLGVKSNLFDKIHISTDSDKIKKISENNNLIVDFMRTKKLTKDNSSIIDVIKFVYNKFKSKGYDFDEIWSLSSCAPLLEVSDLVKVSKKIKNKIVLFVSKYPAPIEWAFIKKKKDIITPLNYKLIKKNSQKFTEKFYDTGTLIIIPKKYFLKKKIILNNNLNAFVLPRHKSVDIDNMDDWNFAKKLYKIKLLKN